MPLSPGFSEWGCSYHCDSATVVRTKVWYRTYTIRGEAFQRTKALWSDWSMVRTMQVISNLRRYDIDCAQPLRLYKQAKRERRGEGELRREENGRESSSALGTRLRVTSSPVPPLLAQFLLIRSSQQYFFQGPQELWFGGLEQRGA